MAMDQQEEDSKVDRLLKSYYAAKKQEGVGECPPIDDLLDYIDDRLAGAQISTIREHLLFCSKCQQVVLYFKLPSSEADEPPLEPAGPPPSLEEFKRRLFQAARPRRTSRWTKLIAWAGNGRPTGLRFWRPAAGLVAAALLLAVLFNLYPSGLSRLAYIDRSSVTDVFNNRRALASPEVGSVKDYYRQGLAALLESQFWKLRRMDEAKVDEGIRYLEKAKRLAEESNDQAYLAEIYFYLGKAYLKKKDVVQARTLFEELKKIRGANPRLLFKQQEASQILNAMDKLKSSR